MQQKTYNTLVWTSFILSIGLAILAWGNTIDWAIGSISAYRWFPLFGIIAWFVMCIHYYAYALRIRFDYLKRPPYFKKLSGYVVLLCLLLHPGILAYAQFVSGEGLPPASLYRYVGESMRIMILAGSLALMIFLSFEIFERLKERIFIKKIWYIISIAQSLAMILIFFHGLNLGSDLVDGWFRIVWIVYGMALIPCIYIIHMTDIRSKQKEQLIATANQIH